MESKQMIIRLKEAVANRQKSKKGTLKPSKTKMLYIYEYLHILRILCCKKIFFKALWEQEKPAVFSCTVISRLTR